MFRCIIVLCVILTIVLPVLSANNPYGVHTMLQDFGHYPTIDKHLTWAKTLIGDGGYVKQLFYPITNSTTGPQQWWIYFVNKCYDLNLNPIIRLGGEIGSDGFWKKPQPDAPGDYTTIANAIKNVVSQLPRRDGFTLYIEVFNEPNLRCEWSGNPNPVEYADFLIDVAAAIRSIGDPRIKILNAGLSVGGDYNNLDFIDAMCTSRPAVTQAFDVWACHPYAKVPPEQNYHNGTTTSLMAIDSYVLELQRLSKYMDISNLKVIGTECGYGGEGLQNADYMMRAFRDYYSKWPEVLAMCPWNFASPFGDADWIYGDSGTDENGYPTHATLQYHYVYKLAKPNMSTGGISGRITEGAFGTWLEGATVVLNPGGVTTTTDARGIYMFAKVTPGTYSITVTKSGFYPQTINNINVTASNNTVVNVALQAEGFGTIQGTVSEGKSGAGIEGVSIVTNPGAYSATSQPNGSYNIFNVNPGTYSMTATKRFYYPHSKTGITVSTGGTTTANFWLGLGGDPANPNMLYNTGFEGTPGDAIASGWISSDGNPHPELFTLDGSVKYAGDTSQRLKAVTSDLYLWQMTDYTSITPGQTYLFQVWCKTSNLVTGSYKGAGLSYGFYSNAFEFKGGGDIPGSLSGTNDWTLIRGTAVAPAGSQRLQVQVRCKGTSGWAWFDQVYVGRIDNTPPSAPTNVVVSDPRTGSDLDISWTHSSDPDLAYVRVYRSTTPGQLGTLIYDKVISQSIRDSGLLLGKTYFYTIRSVDFAGNESTNTNQYPGTPSQPGPSSIALAKGLPNGTIVTLNAKVVSAGRDKFTNTVYIQDLDRTSGIKIYGSTIGTDVVQGSIVNVTGTMSTVSGERIIINPTITIISTGTEVTPIALTCRDLGGGSFNEYTPGITGAAGLNNIGLLVTIFGRVTYSDSSMFYVDDGSGLDDGTGRGQGVQVSLSGLATGNTITPPALNQFVKVTGISTCKTSGDKIIRVLRPRDQGDIVVYP
jgi:hypothetical protein